MANSHIHRLDEVIDNDNYKDIKISILLVRDSGGKVRPVQEKCVPVSIITPWS